MTETKHAAWLESWHVNPSVNKDYDFIDGLRGIAILLVVGCHFVYVNPNAGFWMQFIKNLFSAGSYGVTMFFALSGFLIGWPFWKRKFKRDATVVPPGYGWRRFWKIYPPLALTVILFTPIYIYRSGDWEILSIALRWLTGLPLLGPVSGKVNPVMWSLVVEVHFYLLMPLIFLCLKRISAKASLVIVFLLFALVPLATRWLLYDGWGLDLNPFINVHFPSMMDAFALGLLMAGLECAGALKKEWARLGDIGFLLLIGALTAKACLSLHSVSAFQAEFVGDGVKIASGLLLCYAANPKHPRVRWLCQPWLRWLGITSYELYLIHQPIYVWIRDSVGPAEGSIGKYAFIVGGSFVVSIVFTAILYRWFSLPILKTGRRKHSHAPIPRPKAEIQTQTILP